VPIPLVRHPVPQSPCGGQPAMVARFLEDRDGEIGLTIDVVEI
jgi:hypothetical protein